ncbi:YqaA family protein [Vibrio zhugei]|uniref:YqaA family protein n=1 Tax=Vibrio zhugei TaxID=2479546 RepID=A0ABV7C9R7_9VIBR|nr:YqaA family protein [Vibrio zhugei]
MINSIFTEFYQYVIGYPLLFLFLSAFVSATLIPMGSEAVFLMTLSETSLSSLTVITVASLGNTLGGVTNYVLGRYLPMGRRFQHSERRALDRLQQYGAWILLLSWLPVVGDPLCVAAGWVRISPYLAIIMMLIGKTARYVTLAAIFHQLV